MNAKAEQALIDLLSEIVLCGGVYSEKNVKYLKKFINCIGKGADKDAQRWRKFLEWYYDNPNCTWVELDNKINELKGE